jgi:hypothetical protein
MNFKNTILIVVFNYSNCLNNKEYLEKLYSPFFKKIVYYSDFPKIQEQNDLEFIQIDKGRFTHRIFPHFYKKYQSLINESDGVFYTMDDNIINLKLLHSMDPNKIISAYRESLRYLNEIPNEWHWADYRWGKKAIQRMIDSGSLRGYDINKFCGDFADWFYLPKRYWNDSNIYLFEVFSQYGVFLEIAIPSIIHNIEKDRKQWNELKFMCLWNEDRKKLFDFEFFTKAFDDNLFIHPIKFNEYQEFKKQLELVLKKNVSS